MNKKRVLVVGLIGGIGSGKSLVAAELARRGAFVVSGDRLGHEALEVPEIRERVLQKWGAPILAERGRIDRRKLGAIVFSDAQERKALESMVFPYLERRLREEIDKAEREPQTDLVVLDAAILLEAGWDALCDRMIYVQAPRQTRLARLASQRGWNEKEVNARESSQWPLADKEKRADWTVENSGSVEELSRQLEALLGVLKERHADPNSPQYRKPG